MAAALPWIGAAVAAAGAVQQGQSSAAANRYNAEVALVNARVAREQAASDVTDIQRGGRKALGGIRAAYGASGVRMEGTPVDVYDASAAQVELDALRRTYAGELEAMGFAQQAAGYKVGAQTAQQAGTLNAASSILMSGAQMQQAGAFSQKTGTPVRVQ